MSAYSPAKVFGYRIVPIWSVGIVYCIGVKSKNCGLKSMTVFKVNDYVVLCLVLWIVLV